MGTLFWDENLLYQTLLSWKKKHLIGLKTGVFFQFEEENDIFSSQNIVRSSQNNIPNYSPGQHEEDFTQ